MSVVGKPRGDRCYHGVDPARPATRWWVRRRSMPIRRLNLGGVHAGCTEVIGGWVVAAHPLCSLERGTCWVLGVGQIAYGWLRAPGRGVYVCPVDPQHGQDPQCGGDVVHIERRAPQSRAALVGHATGCWRQLVDTWTVWGSNASSAGVSHALTLEECRFSWLGSQT